MALTAVGCFLLVLVGTSVRRAVASRAHPVPPRLRVPDLGGAPGHEGALEGADHEPLHRRALESEVVGRPPDAPGDICPGWRSGSTVSRTPPAGRRRAGGDEVGGGARAATPAADRRGPPAGRATSPHTSWSWCHGDDGQVEGKARRSDRTAVSRCEVDMPRRGAIRAPPSVTRARTPAPVPVGWSGLRDLRQGDRRVGVDAQVCAALRPVHARSARSIARSTGSSRTASVVRR